VASAPQYLELITVLDYVLIVAKPVLKAAVKSTKVSCMATVMILKTGNFLPSVTRTFPCSMHGPMYKASVELHITKRYVVSSTRRETQNIPLTTKQHISNHWMTITV